MIDTSSFQKRMKRLFKMGFTVMDIAEPLVSFDAEKEASSVRSFMKDSNISVAGVREKGFVKGYVERDDLNNGTCGDIMRRFDKDSILSEDTSIADVIKGLAEVEYRFVSILGHVEASVCRYDIDKPPTRMWLFGMITILEMFFVRKVEELYPDESWRKELSGSRLNKALELQGERKRRNLPAELVDCLQFSDKAKILLKNPEMQKDVGLNSMREGKRMIKGMESLRNNLAHSQDIIASDWEAILTMSKRLDKIMTRI